MKSSRPAWLSFAIFLVTFGVHRMAWVLREHERWREHRANKARSASAGCSWLEIGHIQDVLVSRQSEQSTTDKLSSLFDA